MVKRQNRVNDPASNAPRTSDDNRTDTFTAAPGQPGASGKQPSTHLMESTIVDGAWKGHLGRGLAPRELQFVLSVAQGLTAKEIAKVFDITPGTVVKRLACAMYKLGVHRQGAMVAEAMRRQIITPICLLLVAVMTMQGLDDSGMTRRDRRPTDRRGGELRMTRRADSFDLVG